MIEAGPYAKVCYAAEPDLYHARLLGARVQGARWVVVTPMYDVYVEEIASSNEELIDLRFGGRTTMLPEGLREEDVFSFEPPRAPQVRALLAEASRLAEAEHEARGVAAPLAGLPWGRPT